MYNDLCEILLTEAQIQTRVKELSAQLSGDYAGKDPVFVGVLRGVVMFFSDVVRHFSDHCQIDFMCISSYRGTESTGECIITKDVSMDLQGRHVVILEDIFDTGRSLDFAYNYLKTKRPASLEICTLLDKPSRRDPEFAYLKPKYVGFTIPNKFVVGYGLDFGDHYRNIPYIGVLKPEMYEK